MVLTRGTNTHMDERYRRWYKTKRWRRLRKLVLGEHPMCQCPHCQGNNLEADVVDHITPHRGEARLFWNRKNLQAMNKQCHDKYKQSQEKGGKGFDAGCDTSGIPLNADHHWNQT